MRDRTLVIYHGNCHDGFCAAWLYWRSKYHDEYTKYIPSKYGYKPPSMRASDTVYLFDFSYKREQLEKIHRQVRWLWVFDHHVSAQKDLDGLDYCTFDMQKSGARLVHEWLISKAQTDGDAPEYENWLVDYTEDRDLWRWKLPGSQETIAGLSTFPRKFRVWERLYGKGQEDLQRLGTPVYRYMNNVIRKYTKPKLVSYSVIGGEVVPSLNCTDPYLVSEICGELNLQYSTMPFAATFVLKDDCIVYSLRTRREDVDVSKIASLYGGGGHKQAAGFKVTELLPFFGSMETAYRFRDSMSRGG